MVANRVPMLKKYSYRKSLKDSIYIVFKGFDLYSGREQRIRTAGGVNLAGFQNRYIRPTLSALYLYISGANGRN